MPPASSRAAMARIMVPPGGSGPPNFVHQRHGLFREQIPALILGYFDIGPALSVGEYHDDGLSMLVNLVLKLSELVSPPTSRAIQEFWL